MPNETAAQDSPFFPHYPKTKFHPVHGRKTVNDPNEEWTAFKPAHDWFDTAELADMHRTDTEAGVAIAHNMHVKRTAHTDLVEGREPAPATGDGALKGPVRNSVAAQESLDAGNPEPL